MQMGQLAANPNLNGYYFIKYIVVSLLTLCWQANKCNKFVKKKTCEKSHSLFHFPTCCFIGLYKGLQDFCEITDGHYPGVESCFSFYKNFFHY